MQVPYGLVHHPREPEDVRVDQLPGVHESGLGEERVVRPLHEVLVQVVYGVHDVDSGAQLGEDLAERVRVAIPRDVLQCADEALPEGPPHETGVPASVELQGPQLAEPLPDHVVVVGMHPHGLLYGAVQGEGYELGLQGRVVRVVVEEFPFREDERVGGHIAHEFVIRLGMLQDADPVLRGADLQCLAREAAQEDSVERHVVVHGEGASEPEPVAQLMAALAVVPPVSGEVGGGEPAVGRDGVSEHGPPSGGGDMIVADGSGGSAPPGHPPIARRILGAARYRAVRRSLLPLGRCRAPARISFILMDFRHPMDNPRRWMSIPPRTCRNSPSGHVWHSLEISISLNTRTKYALTVPNQRR